MKNLTTLAAAAALALAFAGPVLAQGSSMMMKDSSMLVSKVVNAAVYNEKGEEIGSVREILVKPGAGQPEFIVAVGPYTGRPGLHVTFPMSKMEVKGDKLMITGATRDALLSMPAFVFGIPGGSG